MIDKTPLPSISTTKLLQKLNNRLYSVRKENANSRQWFLCKQNKTKSFYPQYSVTDEVIKELFSQGILEENEISAPLSSAGRMLIRRIMLNGGEILGQHQDKIRHQIREMNIWNIPHIQHRNITCYLQDEDLKATG